MSKRRLKLYISIFLIFLLFGHSAFADQILKWQSDKNAYEYKVEIRSIPGKGNTNLFYKTTQTLINVSLTSGEYEYRVIAYDFLGRESTIGEWRKFSVIKAVAPDISAPKRVEADTSGKTVEVPVEVKNIEIESTVELVNSKTNQTVQGTLKTVGQGSNVSAASAVFPKVSEGEWKVRVTNPSGLSSESTVINIEDKERIAAEAARLAEEKRAKEEAERKLREEEEKLAEKQAKELAKEQSKEQERLAKELEKQNKELEKQNAKKLEEERRLAEEAEKRRLEEERKALEQKRLEEKALEEAEKKRLAQEQKEREAAEKKRLAEEERKRREEEAERRAAEAARKAAEAKERELLRKEQQKKAKKQAEERRAANIEKAKNVEEKRQENLSALEEQWAKQEEEKRIKKQKEEEARIAREKAEEAARKERERLAAIEARKEYWRTKKYLDLNVQVGGGIVTSPYDGQLFAYSSKELLPAVKADISYLPFDVGKLKIGLEFNFVGSYLKSQNEYLEYSIPYGIFSLDALAHIPLYKDRVFLAVKAGAGVSLLKTTLKYNEAYSRTQNVAPYYGFINVQGGASVYWLITRVIALEVGADFTHIFIKDMQTGIINPYLTVGVRC